MSSDRTRASNGENDVGRGDRSYRGGASEFTALITVVREIPNRTAICAFGTSSQASLLISAQSSKVITLQSLSVHFSSAAIDQFSSAVDNVRTRVKSPGQNGSRERGFGTLKYERLFLDEIPNALTLIERAEDYRVEYNTEHPHEAIAWNRPLEVHLGLADPTTPTFETEEILPTT